MIYKLELISDAYNEIKADDPHTALTLNALRVLVKSEKSTLYTEL